MMNFLKRLFGGKESEDTSEIDNENNIKNKRIKTDLKWLLEKYSGDEYAQKLTTKGFEDTEER